MSTNQIVRGVQRQLAYCTAPHRHARIIRRWARSEPTLATVSIADIVERAAVATDEQNPHLRSLLRLHQGGDLDAGNVLMATAIPVIKRVAMTRLPDRQDRWDSEINSLWGAFAHLIGTIDPDVDLSCDDDQFDRPMLSHFGTRLGSSHDTIDPAERRRRRRSRRNLISVLPCEDDTAETGALVFTDHRTNVADTAIASLELARIFDLVRSGQISDQSWRALIEHRVVKTPPADGTSAAARRVRAMRTARQLSQLVGHAA